MNQVELKMREICDGWAVSNPTARKRLDGVIPTRKTGSSKHYALRDVVLAFESKPDDVNREDMQPRDRKDRADAELKELKVERMRAEQVDSRESVTVIVEMLKRLADSIKATDSLTPKEKRALCKQLQSDAERTVGEIEACKFSDAE